MHKRSRYYLVVSRYIYQIAKILHQTLLALFDSSMEIADSTYCPFCLDLANLACVTSDLQNNPKGLTSRFYLLRSLFDFNLVKHLPEHSVPTSVISFLY